MPDTDRDKIARLVAMKALTIAQIKDLGEQTPRYTAAVTGYLAEHHPPDAYSEAAQKADNSADRE